MYVYVSIFSTKFPISDIFFNALRITNMAQYGLPQWCRATFKHEWNGLLIVCVQLLLFPVTPWIITDFIFYSSLFRYVDI